MPSFTGIIQPTGAELNVSIRPGEPMVQKLRDAGMPVPAPLQVVGVLDIGGSHTAAKRSMLTHNGFLSSNGMGVSTVEKESVGGGRFDVELAVMGESGTSPWMPLAIGELQQPGWNPACAILLGRDFLANFGLTYNIPKGKFTLTWLSAGDAVHLL